MSWKVKRLTLQVHLETPARGKGPEDDEGRSKGTAREVKGYIRDSP